MNKLIIYTAILTLVSCATQHQPLTHKYENAELISSGATTSLGGPNFIVLTSNKVNTSTRSLASNSGGRIPNNRLYFYNLVVQHNLYKRTLGFKGKIKTCPQFHNDFIEDRKTLGFNEFHVSLERKLSSISEDKLAYFPELALVDDQTPLYLFKDNKMMTHFRSALNIQAEKNFSEIQELCDRGSSNGFYVFNNLINKSVVGSNYSEDSELYKAVFKIPAVANMLILKSDQLKSNYIKYHPVERELLSRLGASWVINYIEDINKFRSKKITYKSN